MGLALHNPSDPLPLSNLIEDRQLPTRSELEISPESSFFWSTEAPFGPFARRENNGQLRYRHRPRHRTPPAHGKPPRARQDWDLEASEGRDLALGSSRRPPSLERQEAFRDGRTSKKRACLVGADDFGDDADLYRLGLLYDDEHERGSGFTFDAIVRNEPLYRLNVRPIKRGRRAAISAPSFSHRHGLPLDLSFAAFGDDEAIAQFLISPEESELKYEEDANETSTASAGEVLRPSMTAIYELEPDGSTSFTLQNSTTSISPRTTSHSLANTALEAVNLPDLISDNDHDNDKNDDETNDWEIVQTSNTLIHNLETVANGLQETNTTTTAENAASTSPDAWVVLG